MWTNAARALHTRVEVNLEVSSWIEGRGVKHTNWTVRVRDAWIPVSNLRDVARTIANPEVSFDDDEDEMRVIPAGCQYRITYHPRLPIGTQIRRRVSAPREELPRPVSPPRTLDEALGRMFAAMPPMKPPLKTTFTDWRVDGEHRLITEAQWQRRLMREHLPRNGRPQRDSVPVAEIEAFRNALRDQQ